jgi:uncharacterized protein YuzE
MRITYDGKVNAAMIYLKDRIGPGESARTYVCKPDPDGFGGDINLDFDKSGRLIGIEVLRAHERLPKEILEKADVVG